jgi:hypothetical protein
LQVRQATKCVNNVQTPACWGIQGRALKTLGAGHFGLSRTVCQAEKAAIYGHARPTPNHLT